MSSIELTKRKHGGDRDQKDMKMDFQTDSDRPRTRKGVGLGFLHDHACELLRRSGQPPSRAESPDRVPQVSTPPLPSRTESPDQPSVPLLTAGYAPACPSRLHLASICFYSESLVASCLCWGNKCDIQERSSERALQQFGSTTS